MNKKIVTTAIVSIMAISFFASCGARKRAIQNSATYDVGIVINNVRWATRNVDTPGTFVRNPQDAGGLFVWEVAQNACPRGWRLPTYDELQSLRNAGGEWTAGDRVNGRTFGMAPHQLFLPAAGWRSSTSSAFSTNRAFSNVGTHGLYWSSTSSDTSHVMYLLIARTGSTVNTANPASGFSVRCVAE